MPIDEQLVEPGKHFSAGRQVREVLEIATEMVPAGDNMRKVTWVSYRDQGNKKETWADLTAFAQEVDTDVKPGEQ
jgi:hypothetical protein